MTWHHDLVTWWTLQEEDWEGDLPGFHHRPEVSVGEGRSSPCLEYWYQTVMAELSCQTCGLPRYEEVIDRLRHGVGAACWPRRKRPGLALDSRNLARWSEIGSLGWSTTRSLLTKYSWYSHDVHFYLSYLIGCCSGANSGNSPTLTISPLCWWRWSVSREFLTLNIIY